MTTDDAGFTRYAVGEPFERGRTNLPPGVGVVLHEDEPLQVILSVFKPNLREVEAVQTGRSRFAWVEHGVNGRLLFKFGSASWGDCPYSPHQFPSDLQMRPRGTHRIVIASLVAAETGLIAALRQFTWPAYFINTIVESLSGLAAKPYSVRQRLVDNEDFIDRYPDGPAIYRLSTTLPREAKCEGGQRDDKPF